MDMHIKVVPNLANKGGVIGEFSLSEICHRIDDEILVPLCITENYDGTKTFKAGKFVHTIKKGGRLVLIFDDRDQKISIHDSGNISGDGAKIRRVAAGTKKGSVIMGRKSRERKTRDLNSLPMGSTDLDIEKTKIDQEVSAQKWGYLDKRNSRLKNTKGNK